MANKNFIVKNGLEVGGQEVVSSSGVVTSEALGGQTLASTDSPTFNNLTLTNDIAVGGDINLTGDLNITGDVNSVSVTDLDVTDQTITLGKGQAESASGGSGIVIDGSGASILWNETNTQFDINNALNVSSASTDVAKFVSAGSYTFIALDNATRDWALSAGSSFGIYDKDASATRLSIDASGNVGIGTSPSTALDVQGAIQASESGGDFIRMQTDGNNNIFDVNSGAYVFRTSGFSERMRINAAGGLSINDNIENPLSLNRTTTTTGASYMKFTNAGGNYYIGADSSAGDRMAIGGQAYGFTMTAESGRPLVFATSNIARMAIDSSGNVGIGTTAPSQKLEVSGIIKLGGMMLQNTAGGGSIGFNRNPANGADISGLSLRRFQINGPGTTSGDYLEIQSYNSSGTSVGNIRIVDGGIGIGTTPTYLTDLYGTIGDQSPLLRGTAHNTSTSNFNWISEFLMPNLSGGHRVVHAIGSARSNGNAATIGFYEHATDSNFNAFNVGIFGNNDILSVCYNTRVGIATQTPSSTLTVNGQIESLKDSYNEGGQLILRAPSSVSSSKRFNIDTFALSGASTMRFFSEDDSDGGNGAVHMYIKANGFVGINTAPNYQFDLRGQNSGTNGHMAYIENNGGGGNGCTFSVQHADGNHSWGVVQELRIQSGSGTDNPSILFSSGTESTNTWTVGYGYTDNNFRIKKDHGYHNGNWGTAVFTMDRSGNVTISGSLTENSDERLKENITTIPNALDKVSQLRGVTFDWKERDDEGNARSSMGLIAQEVEAVEGLEILVTEVANDGSPEMEEFQPKGVIYQNMVGLLVESIKELKTELDAAKARITELEG